MPKSRHTASHRRTRSRAADRAEINRRDLDRLCSNLGQMASALCLLTRTVRLHHAPRIARR